MNAVDIYDRLDKSVRCFLRKIVAIPPVIDRCSYRPVNFLA